MSSIFPKLGIVITDPYTEYSSNDEKVYYDIDFPLSYINTINFLNNQLEIFDEISRLHPPYLTSTIEYIVSKYKEFEKGLKQNKILKYKKFNVDFSLYDLTIHEALNDIYIMYRYYARECSWTMQRNMENKKLFKDYVKIINGANNNEM